MQTKKLNIILIIIIILLVCIIGNFIKKDYLNNEKIILKAMTKEEHEDNITSLNQSHNEYLNYIEESKTKIASALTDMGITTSNEETLENMASNIRSIARDASSISYDNSSSKLTSTNVQGAVDELNNNLGGLRFGTDGEGNFGYFGADDSLIPFNNNKGYCFEPVSNFSISASGTKTITPVYLTEVIGFVCTSTWNNTYGILFLKDAIKYDGSSLGALKIPSHLNMSITFNNNNSVTLRNGDSTMGCSLRTCYLIGLV